MNDFIFDEGRVYGSRYYTVEPRMTWDPNWYNQHWDNMERWCSNTLGDIPRDVSRAPNARWYAFNSRFYFREKEDQMMFVLKWS